MLFIRWNANIILIYSSTTKHNLNIKITITIKDNKLNKYDHIMLKILVKSRILYNHNLIYELSWSYNVSHTKPFSALIQQISNELRLRYVVYWTMKLLIIRRTIELNYLLNENQINIFYFIISAFTIRNTSNHIRESNKNKSKNISMLKNIK